MVHDNCYWNRDDCYCKPDTKSGSPSSWHGTKELDGGIFFTQFSHFIDLMHWHFGYITKIRVRLNDFPHQNITDFADSGFFSFDFRKGVTGSYKYSTAVRDKNLESFIAIIAEKESVKVGGHYMNEVEYCHINYYTMRKLSESNPPNYYGQYKGSAANHHYIYENMAEVILDNGKITTNELEGIKVVDSIERIYNYSTL